MIPNRERHPSQKKMFAELFNAGYFPTVIDAEKVKQADIAPLVRKTQKQQFSEITPELKYRKRALIIDDFSKIKLNKKYIESFIKNCKESNSICIFICLDSYQYIAPEIEEFDDFDFYEIIPFGNIKRTELIEKWVSMGQEETIEDKSLYKKTDNIKSKIDSMVRKKIIPPKPLYLLTLLQMLESYTPQKLELTSHGHCYQHLVYKALENSKIPNQEIDKYLNVLTELGWYVFDQKKTELNEQDLNTFFDEYRKKYLAVDSQDIIENLIRCSILEKREYGTSFKYLYIYYFFAAKRMADTFRNDNHVKDSISDLLHNLHKEDSANIIIFITHHTKDDWIIDELQLCLMGLFESQEPAHLEAEKLTFMSEFIDDIPDLVIERRKIRDERLKHEQLKDEADNKSKEIDKQIEQSESTDILARINKTFKGIEIAGQIINNRHASLTKHNLYQLINEGITTGLRFLGYFLTIADSSKTEVIKIIEHHLKEHPNLTNKEVQKAAESTFLFLTYGTILGVIKKVSTSIGSAEAQEIYKEIDRDFDTSSINLINQAIDLHFHKSLNFSEIERLNKKFTNNPTCARILKEIIVQHTYMFPVEYKDKQRISSMLNIPMNTQRNMDRKKQIKQ
ncbi:STAND family AAA ATPase [Endozoicomonas numazuensis]